MKRWYRVPPQEGALVDSEPGRPEQVRGMARPEQVAKLLDFDFPKPTSQEGPGAGGGLDSEKGEMQE